MRHLIDWHLLPEDVWEHRIEAALRAAAGPRIHPVAAGRAIALVFFNSSLRTRTSMEVAAVRLGAHPTPVTPGQGTWGFAWEEGVVMSGSEAEHITEAVGVLSRYYDAIGVRLFASLNDRAADRDETRLHQFVRASGVPVVNLESAFWHPCQALADAAAMTERFDGAVAGRKFVLTWAHHPKALPTAVPNSALLAAARLGMNVTIARPDGYQLDPSVMDLARSYAEARGTTIEESDNQAAACEGADVIYAKSWAGSLVYEVPEAEDALRRSLVRWRVTPELMSRTNEAAFMHCLPVRRNVVVDDAVLDSPASIHLRQAEYRLYAQQAILTWMWNLPDVGGSGS